MDHVNFPSDISLILLSLRGDLFQEAIAITQLCAMFAHGFTATLVHFARLREIDGDNDVFIPYSKILYWPSLDIPVSLSDSDDKEAVDEEDVAEDKPCPSREDVRQLSRQRLACCVRYQIGCSKP